MTVGLVKTLQPSLARHTSNHYSYQNQLYASLLISYPNYKDSLTSNVYLGNFRPYNTEKQTRDLVQFLFFPR